MLTRDLPTLFSEVNHPAKYYPAHPDSVQGYLAGGGLTKDITRGRYRLRPTLVQIGNTERIQHVPTYRLETTVFKNLGIAEDKCIEVEDPVTCITNRFRVVYWESDNHGLTTIYLGGLS